MNEQWRLIGEYDVAEYRCGLRAGDRVRLIRDLEIADHIGAPTTEILQSGGIWQVLHGSRHDPGTVWLRQPDGQRHTWSDDDSIFEHFARVPADE